MPFSEIPLSDKNREWSVSQFGKNKSSFFAFFLQKTEKDDI